MRGSIKRAVALALAVAVVGPGASPVYAASIKSCEDWIPHVRVAGYQSGASLNASGFYDYTPN